MVGFCLVIMLYMVALVTHSLVTSGLQRIYMTG
jgi:hypothetical protein